MSKMYYIPTSSALPAAVEAWSTARLPFEPHGWELDFRRDLRAAVQQLAAPPDMCLHAIYTAARSDGSDAENALFYNVGPAAFARGMANGVRFERASTKAPACPIALTDDGTQALHHYSYALALCTASWQVWQPDAVLATWAVPLTANDLHSCAAIWRAMKQEQQLIQAVAQRGSIDEPFGLRLRLEVSDRSALRVHTLLKPLLDGVISALHRYAGDPTPEVCRYLAEKLQINADEIRRWLADSTSAVLGPRQALVAPFRAGVKWNPQDDACAAADIQMMRSQGSMTLRGEIVTLKPRAPAGARFNT